MAALLGTFDPNHHERILSGKSGLQLVLHHGPNGNSHHHGAIAQALTLLAQPPTPSNPDHVIQFGSTEASQMSRPSGAQTAPLSVAWFQRPSFSLAPENSLSFSLHLPGDKCRRFSSLRSTVLLI